MVINTNFAAVNSRQALAESADQLNRSLSRMASGSKLVEPQDDAAGLAVATKFTAAISRNEAVKSNLINALSFSQTQDGYLQKVSHALDRMSEIMVLAFDDITTEFGDSNVDDRFQDEFRELENFISDVGTRDFNGVSLFAGNALGVTKDSDGNTWNLNSVSLNATGGDLNAVYDITTEEDGIDLWSVDQDSLDSLTTAIENIATSRAKVGANIQRLNLTEQQVSTLNENLSTSISRIKDVDLAQESTRFARYNVLTQSATAMISQANLIPQNALRLLQ